MGGGHIAVRVGGNAFLLAGGGDNRGDNCCDTADRAGHRDSLVDTPTTRRVGRDSHDTSVCCDAFSSFVVQVWGQPMPEQAVLGSASRS